MPRDLTAVMLDLLELAEGKVPRKIISEGHAALAAHLMQVGTPVARGRPRTVDRAAIHDLVARNPEITSAEGAAIVGCSVDAFAKIRRGDR